MAEEELLLSSISGSGGLDDDSRQVVMVLRVTEEMEAVLRPDSGSTNGLEASAIPSAHDPPSLSIAFSPDGTSGVLSVRLVLSFNVLVIT